MKTSGLDFIDAEHCWPIEHDGVGPFRWTRNCFSVGIESGSGEYLTLQLASQLEENILSMAVEDGWYEVPLAQGW